MTNPAFCTRPGAHPPTYRWQLLILLHIAAGLLVLSWMADPTRMIWDWIDETAFIALNGWLAYGHPMMKKAAAFANSSLYDKISALILLCVLGLYTLFGRAGSFSVRAAQSAFICLFMLIVVNIRRDLNLFEIGRPSPSLTEGQFYNLRDSFPEIKPKISSTSSFPGDHAISCIIFVTLFWFLAGSKWALASLTLTPFFVLPRMISGAHWFTDAAVGGVFFCLIVLSWTLCTPFWSWCCRGIYAPLGMIEARVRLGNILK
jgi:membrane-associated phospholipid phosphatase